MSLYTQKDTQNLKEKKTIKIIFKFKSFHYYNLNLIVGKILKKIQELSLINSGIVSLPKKIQRFTVLRSPHVDKKSREQFEIISHNKCLVIFFDFKNIFDKQKAKLLINFIKNSSLGIQLKIFYKI